VDCKHISKKFHFLHLVLVVDLPEVPIPSPHAISGTGDKKTSRRDGMGAGRVGKEVWAFRVSHQ
jgi:hypothetical protein